MTVTAQDRAWADELLQAVKDDDASALAKLIAAIHARAVSCAVVRIENEFVMKSREQALGRRPKSDGSVNVRWAKEPNDG